MYTFPLLITKDSKLIAFQNNITNHLLPLDKFKPFFELELLKATLAHYAKLKNNRSTTCFSTVLDLALFGKNSPAGGF